MPILKNILTYEGCNNLKYRLLLSVLSGKPIQIVDIRLNHDDPGLREYEVSLIRLLDRMTNGTRVELNETGTSLTYSPGLLIGGQIEHDCNLQRGLGYYLEAIMILAPFCKTPVDIKLKGVTNNDLDPSVDMIKAAGIPVLKRFIIGDCDLALTINKRGAAPSGGGEIHFKCPVNRTVKSIQLENSGMVKRIRGVAYSLRVSPSLANRLVQGSKGVLLKFLPDVYIHTDHCREANSGNSPGYGINLVAETTTGVFFSSDICISKATSQLLSRHAEEYGKQVAMKLLDEIHRNGCIDSAFQSMTALFMALGKKDVSKVLVGSLTQATIQFLRDLKDFFGIVFKLEAAKDENDEVLDQVLMTCIGIGYSNISKKVL